MGAAAPRKDFAMRFTPSKLVVRMYTENVVLFHKAKPEMLHLVEATQSTCTSQLSCLNFRA